MNAEHPRSGHGTLVIQQKYEAHSTPDQTELQDAFLVQRSVQPRGHGIRTILRVPGNANGIPAQAFDLVMTALRLHVDPGTGCQAVAIDQFSRRHTLKDQRVVSVAVSFQEWRPSLCGCDFEASLLLLTTDSFGAANSDWKPRNRRNGSGQQLIVIRGAVWPSTVLRV